MILLRKSHIPPVAFREDEPGYVQAAGRNERVEMSCMSAGRGVLPTSCACGNYSLL
jgi:hypothetical protein